MKSIARLLSISALLTGAFAALPSYALPITFATTMSGPAESPPNASPGTGVAVVVFDEAADTMQIEVNFSGLVGNSTLAHIHCCVALAGSGTAAPATTIPTLPDFPAGVQSGTYNRIFDLTLASTYNSAFISASGGTEAGAEAALLAGLLAGQAYFNVHSTDFGGGEIRGFFVADTPVPISAPSALVLLLTGGLLLARYSSDRQA